VRLRCGADLDEDREEGESSTADSSPERY